MGDLPFVFPVSVLDKEAITRVKERMGHSERPDTGFLIDFGLADIIDEKEMCCIEAVLLFSSAHRRKYFPRAGIRVFSVEGTDREEAVGDRLGKKQFDGPLFDMLDEVFEYMPRVIGKSARLYSLFLKEMPEYPKDAWQEFIVNAVVHRDYSIQTNEIEIWVFDDRIEIESPGKLCPGIVIEDLKKSTFVHASRNPKLADIFSAAGLMEELGRGIHRVMGVMDKSYLNPPEFQNGEARFKVIMQNSPVFDVGDEEWEQKVRKLDLNLNQKRILIVNKDTSFSNSDYQDINHCDRDTAYREIHEIVEKKYIKCEGKEEV